MNIKIKKSIFFVVAIVLSIMVIISALFGLNYIAKTNEPSIPVSKDTIALMPVASADEKPQKVELNKIVDAIGRVDVFDSQRKWEQSTDVNIFYDEQYERNGLIAPYTHGEYTYNVKNYFKQNIVYSMKFGMNNYYEIPLKFKISDQNGNYLVGSKENFSKLTDTRSMNYSLKPNGVTTYKIEWMWETENDTEDTYLGVVAAYKAIDYNVSINIFSELDGTPVTSDNTNLTLILVLIGCIVLVFVLALFVKGKR